MTHDAIDALTLADRVLVLDEGRVAQVGPSAEVAARVPGATAVVLAGSGHACHLTHPSELAAVVLDAARRAGPG